MNIFIWTESLKIRYNLKYLVVNMRIILKWMLKKYGGSV
jgi:hypothetical protein